MRVLIKDGIIVRLSSDIQAIAFKNEGWEDLGAVNEATTPKTPVNLNIAEEPKREAEEVVAKTRKKPGRKPKA